MFKKILQTVRGTKKPLDYEKISMRASIKDVMKMRSLRAINFANYRKWKYGDPKVGACPWVHSLKLNVLNGYLDVYLPRESEKDNRAGAILEEVTPSQYKEVHSVVQDILADEDKIPCAIRKNILVRLFR